MISWPLRKTLANNYINVKKQLNSSKATGLELEKTKFDRNQALDKSSRCEIQLTQLKDKYKTLVKRMDKTK